MFPNTEEFAVKSFRYVGPTSYIARSIMSGQLVLIDGYITVLMAFSNSVSRKIFSNELKSQDPVI